MIAKMTLEGAARERIELNSNAERNLLPKRLLEVELRAQKLRRKAPEGEGKGSEKRGGKREAALLAKMIPEGAARERLELYSKAERNLIPKRLLEVALREQTSRESTNDKK